MSTTWKQFKDAVDKRVRDSNIVAYISVSNLDPRCLEVTQLIDTDPDTNVYAITSADEPIAAP